MSPDRDGEGAADETEREEREHADAEGEERERADDAEAGEGDLAENVGRRFDRLPATDAERTVAGRPSREAVLAFWADRYGVPPATFEGYTFWEKGAGKVWIHRGAPPSPIEVEALGMTFLRVRQEHWKPTTDAVQRFGRHASRNVVELSPEQARRFVAGEDQPVDWDGDWGYLIAARDVAGGRAPVGVGLFLHGELRSMVPKGRRRTLRG